MVKEVEHGTVEGWQIISVAGPSSTIPQPFIEDVALIIDQMRSKGEIAKLLECMEKLNFHVSQDTDPHHMRIENFAAQILENLYIKYRMLGYVTDKEEMYRRMFYDLDLATWAEIRGKQESTKALHVPGFRYLVDDHETTLNAHHGAFSQFLDKNTCPYIPVISLVHFCNKSLIETVESGNNTYTKYTIKEDWCPTQGCMVFGIHHHSPVTPNKIATITDGTTSLEFYFEPVLGITIYFTKPGMTKTLIYVEEIAYDDFTYAFAFSYTTNKLYFKSILSENTKTIDFPNFYLNPNEIQFHLQWKEKSTDSTLKSFWYYNNPVVTGSMLTSILS